MIGLSAIPALLDQLAVRVCADIEVPTQKSIDRHISPQLWAHVLERVGHNSSTPPRFIDEGTRGAAFHIDGNKVLKITSDATEATSALKVMKHPSKYVFACYDVFKIGKSGRYGIVMEPLERCDSDWASFVAYVGSDPQRAIKYHYHNGEPDRLLAAQYPKEMTDWLKGFAEYLDEIGITHFSDLSDNNLMKRQNGEHVAIDLGYSEHKEPAGEIDVVSRAINNTATARVIRRVIRVEPCDQSGRLPYPEFDAGNTWLIAHDLLDHLVLDEAPIGTIENEIIATGVHYFLDRDVERAIASIGLNQSEASGRDIKELSGKLRKLAASAYQDAGFKRLEKIAAWRLNPELLEEVMSYVSVGFELGKRAYKVADWKSKSIHNNLARKLDNFMTELCPDGKWNLGYIDVGIVIDTDKESVELTDKIDQRFFEKPKASYRGAMK